MVKELIDFLRNSVLLYLVVFLIYIVFDNRKAIVSNGNQPVVLKEYMRKVFFNAFLYGFLAVIILGTIIGLAEKFDFVKTIILKDKTHFTRAFIKFSYIWDAIILSVSGVAFLFRFKGKLNIKVPKTERAKPIIKEKNLKDPVPNASLDTNLKPGCPPLSLLTQGQTDETQPDSNDDYAKKLTERLKRCFQEYDIDFLKIENIEVGPVIIKFTLSMTPQGRISKITQIEKEICVFLKVSSITINPSENGLILEIPHQNPYTIPFLDCIKNKKHDKNKPLEIPIGQSAVGKLQTIEINKMPHLLIAGTTGSGKSVCINVIISSILYKASPEEVRFLFIDPKIVELSIYNGIPHLLTPVITDVEKSYQVLAWAVSEMNKRYQQFADATVRDIEAYNLKHEKSKMYYIVIVIDELADLMGSVKNRSLVEGHIQSLGQKARASGIHLIVGTQRPSADVITGTIKSNILGRIAFAVADSINSRVILNHAGAEKLLGKGDGFLLTAEVRSPLRFKSAFISEKEIENIVDWWKGKSTNETSNSVNLEDTNIRNGNSSSESKKNEDNNESADDENVIKIKNYIARQYITGEFFLPGKLKLAQEIKMNVNKIISILNALEDEGWVKKTDLQNKGLEICADEDDILAHLKKYDYKFYIEL